MDQWPTVAIVLYTYDRRDYAERTLRCALERISYSGPLLVHIADDGSPNGYVFDLERLAGGYPWVRAVSASNAERRGYGASHNLATQHVHQAADVVLALEDDWELLRPLYLDPLVLALQDPRIDCIRMGYIGYTQPLRCEFIEASEQHFLLLDPASPEPHVFAGHPRLVTVQHQKEIGPWPEGIDPGTTEYLVAMRPIARQGVVWPVDLIHPRGDLFAHIGTVQARHDQRSAVLP